MSSWKILNDYVEYCTQLPYDIVHIICTFAKVDLSPKECYLELQEDAGDWGFRSPTTWDRVEESILDITCGEWCLMSQFLQSMQIKVDKHSGVHPANETGDAYFVDLYNISFICYHCYFISNWVILEDYTSSSHIWHKFKY